MMQMTESFVDLMRVALGVQTELSTSSSQEEWWGLFKLAQRQSVVGLLFTGIERLPKEQRPGVEVIMDWSAVADYIEKDNVRLNTVAVKVCEIFCMEGVDMCVMKGQGLAALYDTPLRRTGGDIDVWMDGGEATVTEYMKKNFKSVECGYYHVSTVLKGNIDLEVHFLPINLFEPKSSEILCGWIEKEKPLQWSNKRQLAGDAGTINVPTKKFDLVYVLVHLFHHFLIEGCGMKQVLDYYYLLLSIDDEEDMEEVKSLFKEIGLWDFVGALMYIMQILGLPKEKMLCEPCESLGVKMMDEIINTGTVSGIEIKEKRKGVRGLAMTVSARASRLTRLYPFAPQQAKWVMIENVKNGVKNLAPKF